MSTDSRVLFSEICGLMERIQRKSSADTKKELLRDFISRWKAISDQKTSDAPSSSGATNSGSPGSSFHPALRMLVPQLDNERAAYGIKENTLAKHYIHLLALGKDSPNALRLLNYRAPSSGGGASDSGDFAAVAFCVLETRVAEKGSLTVRDVNDSLDKIALGNATNNKDIVRDHLKRLLKNLSPIESKWVIRVILKGVRVGMSATTILNTFHPDAEDLYNVSSSLSRVCRDLHDVNRRLNEVEVQLFTPFRPMLADRIPAVKVSQLIPSQTFLIGTKMDGERMQLHKKGDEYRYFSRGSKDYTASFGKSPLLGPLTPHLAQAFGAGVDSCILDGEMMAYSTSLQQYLTKGQHVDVKSLNSSLPVISDPDVHPCFVAFDILLLNGEVLCNKPLHIRHKHLQECLIPTPGRLEIVDQHEGTNTEDILAALNSAIDRHEEGIIVKNPDSVYSPDKRKHSGWFKIKPDYEQNVMSDLDLLIIGGYRGSGRRAKVISHFMLAIMDGKQYVSFCKIGSGYSDLQLKDILKNLDPQWTKTKPENVAISAEKPEVFIAPEKSLVLTVRAAEMVESHKFSSGFTLRFPRLEKTRDDKPISQITSKEDILSLWKQYHGKLATSHVSAESCPVPKKKPRSSPRLNKPIKVDERFRTDLSGVTSKCGTFNGRDFCVMSAPEDIGRQNVEREVVEHGGSVVQNPGRDTFCVITDRVNVRVRNVIKGGKSDVVSYDWLRACLDSGEMTQWQPQHMYFVSGNTHPLFVREYGEDYTEKLIKY